MARLIGPALALLLVSLLSLQLTKGSLVELSAQQSPIFNPNGGEGSLRPEECPAKCDYRCSKTAYRKACLFFCNKCCLKCLCVPSGTYGHKEECPCYDKWKTQEGGPKCP